MQKISKIKYKNNIILERLQAISLIAFILLTMSCGGISYITLYKNANNSTQKTIVLTLIYQIPSERIKQIVYSNNHKILLQKEIERISIRQGISQYVFKKNQLQRVQYANTMYSEQLKKGMFTDRGRIYIKYGEPTVIMDVDDTKLGKTQKWNYSNHNKTFIFLYNDEYISYKLYNIHDEEYFQ